MGKSYFKIAANDQFLSLMERVLGEQTHTDIPELNAVCEFVRLDTNNNNPSDISNIDDSKGSLTTIGFAST